MNKSDCSITFGNTSLLHTNYMIVKNTDYDAHRHKKQMDAIFYGIVATPLAGLFCGGVFAMPFVWIIVALYWHDCTKKCEQAKQEREAMRHELIRRGVAYL